MLIIKGVDRWKNLISPVYMLLYEIPIFENLLKKVNKTPVNPSDFG